MRASFICGCGHTGTSLLASMFAAHPEIYVPARETEVFLAEAEAESRWSALLEEAKSSGKSYLVEKTPRHIYELDLIERLAPESRIILTVRDGRDVAASYIKRSGSSRVGAERWIKETTLVSLALARDNTILVRYEDLIQDTAAQLQRLCEFMDLPFNDSMLEYYRDERLWFGVNETRRGTGEAGLEHKLLRNWQIHQPLFDGRGAWKGKLTNEVLELFEHGAGRKLMQQFGYFPWLRTVTEPQATHDDAELAQLREQLRCLQNEHDRSTEMAAEVIENFGESFRRNRRRYRKADDTTTSDTLPLEDGKAFLPLSVKAQRVALPRVDVPHVLCATALCAHSSDVVTLQIHAGSQLGASPHSVVASGARTSDGTNVMQLVAGESKTLLTLPAHTDECNLTVNRVGGSLCMLRLELYRADESADTHEHCLEPSGGKSTSAPARNALWRAQLLLREGYMERAIDVATAHTSEVERSALHLLHATAAAHDDAAWLAQVNQYVASFGIARIELASTGPSRYLRLAARAPQAIVEGPKVSVLMPAFNAVRTVEFAAASILAQSWRPLELILIDDCSSDGTWHAMQRIAATDSRVKLRRNDTNVGPYVSKNLALSMISGQYVTCHDADDWAHPQRIENQIGALLRHPRQAPACVAGHVRVTDSGVFDGFTRIGETSHDGALRLAHMSCMMRTDFMRRYIGHWDCVRFAADGEILERLTRVLGEDLLRLRQLSMFSLDTPSSLSQDSAHGISKTFGFSLVRRQYRDSWREWHATVSLDDARLDFPPTPRRFAAPRECLVPEDSITSMLASPRIIGANDTSISGISQQQGACPHG